MPPTSIFQFQMLRSRVTWLLALVPFVAPAQAADQPAYQPCPLIRAYYPYPAIDKSSDAIKAFGKDLTDVWDRLVRAGVRGLRCALG